MVDNQEEPLITGATAAALVAGVGVFVETIALIATAGATIGCEARAGSWACAHQGAFAALVLLGPIASLVAGVALAGRWHRAWPLIPAVLLAVASVALPTGLGL